MLTHYIIHSTQQLFMRYLVQDTKQGRTSKKLLLLGQGDFLYLTMCLIKIGSNICGRRFFISCTHSCTMTSLWRTMLQVNFLQLLFLLDSFFLENKVMQPIICLIFICLQDNICDQGFPSFVNGPKLIFTLY